MRTQLSASSDKHKRGDLGRVLSAAHHFLNHSLQADDDKPQRAEAYKLFQSEFLRHSRGASPAVSLIRRQISERVPMTTEGAVIAFKAARNRAPRLREILPIVPKDVSVELIYIYANALVEEGQAPQAVREMIGTSLAAVRSEAAEAAQASSFPSSSPAPQRSQRSSSSTGITEVPPHEWDFELHLPLINAHFPTSDFRGALRALNDLRTGARMAREKALEEGRAWPGTARRPIVNCYTAIMSLWVRSMFAGYTGHGRAGRRLGSGVPHRLAVDLGNLLAPVPGKSARQAKRPHSANTPEAREAPPQANRGTPVSATLLTSALADGNPMLSLTAGSSLDGTPRRYRHLQPFLAAWFNAERVAGNTELAAAVWEQISGQTVAQSISGAKPPHRPSPDAYEILLKLLKANPPPSFRPLVSTILDDGKGEITPELLDTLLSCVVAPPIRTAIDWSSIASPWPSTTTPSPTTQLSRPPPAAPAPDLALAFVLLEEHKHLLRPRSLNLAGAAIIHSARRGANPTRYRGDALRHVLSPDSGTGPSMDEWTWLNIVLWDTEKAEALRSGRPPASLPAFPLGPASEYDVLAANSIGQEREAKGGKRDEELPPLVHTVLPAVRRLLLNTVLVAARQRGVEGPASEIFMGELRALQDDMRGAVPAGVGEGTGGKGEEEGVMGSAANGNLAEGADSEHRSGRTQGMSRIRRTEEAKAAD